MSAPVLSELLELALLMLELELELELEVELERELPVLDMLAAEELLLALDLLIAEELLEALLIEEALLELCEDGALDAEDVAELELSPPTGDEAAVFAASPPLQAVSHEHATISTTILRKLINMTPSQGNLGHLR